jgi:hypothetical protein
MKQSFTTLVSIEPRGVVLKQSDVPTSPLDGVTAVLIEHQIFQVFNFAPLPLAFTRAAFNSQLKLN